MQYKARLPNSNVNVSPTSPLKELFLLTGALLTALIGLYALLGVAVDLVVPHISTDLEKKMAGVFVRSIDAKHVDSQKQIYVQSLLNDLQSRCTKLPYHFKAHVRESSTMNALAMPGGHIMVFTGLLDKMNSENELAFVMAHEMGHYAHRDHLRGFGRAMVVMTLSALSFGPDSGVSKILAHSLNLTELSFSRDQETWADEFALETLTCAYGHAAGATAFFEKIPEEQDAGKFGHYFSSHPETHRRISHLKDLIHSRGLKLAATKAIPNEIRH